MSYNTLAGLYENLMAQDGFAPLIKRETLIPCMLQVHSGDRCVDEASAQLDWQEDHSMSHLAYVFGRKLKEMVWHNTIYREEDENVPSYSTLCALRRAHGDDQLPFVFSEMEDAVMSTLKIKKVVPPPL